MTLNGDDSTVNMGMQYGCEHLGLCINCGNTILFVLQQVGDVIKVTKQNDNGMWEGELNGKQGHFPFKLVEVIDSNNHQ